MKAQTEWTACSLWPLILVFPNADQKSPRAFYINIMDYRQRLKCHLCERRKILLNRMLHKQKQK